MVIALNLNRELRAFSHALTLARPLAVALPCVLSAFAGGDPVPVHPAPVLALVGATLVDVSDLGHGNHDLPDSVVLVRDGAIVAVGTRGKLSVPADARVVDVTGKFILPGLIDGFAGLNSQAQASAHLYMGVTSIVASGDDRRGKVFLSAHPGPHVYLMDSVGTTDAYSVLGRLPEWESKLKGRDVDVELSWDDTSRMMDDQARMGIRALWLGHLLTAENTLRIIAKAKELGLATYGEFIATPYPGPIREGVSLLLHMSRYELGMASPELLRPLAADPFGPASAVAYDAADIDPSDRRVAGYARLIADHRVALMPTFSLFYPQLPGHRNLWKEPAAAILDRAGVFKPTDQTTGEPAYRSEKTRQSREALAQRLWAVNREFARAHPRYLAATGSAVFGSLPGISMHVEMEMLVRLGLTPREALAAATSNYSEQFGWHELGLVAAGRRADLLVLRADPLADIRNTSRIDRVFVDGTEIDREALLRRQEPNTRRILGANNAHGADSTTRH
jgi:hypothetical protein